MRSRVPVRPIPNLHFEWHGKHRGFTHRMSHDGFELFVLALGDLKHELIMNLEQHTRLQARITYTLLNLDLVRLFADPARWPASASPSAQ